MPPSKPKYPPPVSLRDLFDVWGSDVLHILARRLPGAVEQPPKQNERWRVSCGAVVVLGYISSCVVASPNAAATDQIAARLRQLATPTERQRANASHSARIMRAYLQHYARAPWGEDMPAALDELLLFWGDLDPVETALALAGVAQPDDPRNDAAWYEGIAKSILYSYHLGCATCPAPAPAPEPPEPLRLAGTPGLHVSA